MCLYRDKIAKNNETSKCSVLIDTVLTLDCNDVMIRIDRRLGYLLMNVTIKGQGQRGVIRREKVVFFEEKEIVILSIIFTRPLFSKIMFS